jgi:hypothetical protein
VTTINLVGQLIHASADTQTLRYRLLTYGEPGRTNVGLITASKGSVKVPADVAALRPVNMQHDDKRPAGKFLTIMEHAEGLDCEVRCLPTTVGHDAYIEASERVRPGISVELANAAVRGGQLVTADLVGAAFVTAPAFPSSLVMAADVGDLPDDFPDYLLPTETSSESTEEIVVNGVTYVIKRTTTSTQTVDPKNPEDAPPPSEDDNAAEGTPDATTQEGTTVTASAALGTVQAVPTITAAATTEPREPTFRDVVNLLAAVENSPEPGDILAALSDIKVSGTGAVGVTALQTGWLGELWSGRQYQRRYIPLASSADLTSLSSVGWQWDVAPEVDDWSGNKTAVPSNSPTTKAVPSAAKRLAGAHDVDRAYRDFNVTEYWDAYFRAMTESYSRKSDLRALSAYIAGATAVTGEGTLGDTSVWSMLVDGAIAVLGGGGVPTGAVVGLDLYRSALLTPKDEVIALLSSTLGLEEGTLADFKLVPAPDASTLAGQVLVQDRAAVTFKELPGTPIRVEGLDMVKGGVDPGLFGYYDVLINSSDAIALVSKPAA